jgi:hypothetical protein
MQVSTCVRAAVATSVAASCPVARLINAYRVKWQERELDGLDEVEPRR